MDPSRLIKFSGTIADNTRSDFNIPVSRAVSTEMAMVFAIYADQSAQTPLWSETQNVLVDSAGHYNVLLGSVSQSGVPSDIFAEGAARWLGVRIGNGEEQRVVLVSVPYAMKAQDATTLDGHALGGFMLKADGTGVGGKRGRLGQVNVDNGGGSGGTTNTVAKWTNGTTIGNSLIYDDGTYVGVGTNVPWARFTMQAASGSQPTLSVQNSDFVNGSAGSGVYLSTGAATGTTYGQIQAFNSGNTVAGAMVLNPSGGNVGVGTTNPTFRLSVQGAAGGNGALDVQNSDFVSGSVGSGFYMATGATSGNTYGQLQAFQSGNSAVGPLALNPYGGNVGIGTTVPSYTFDIENSDGSGNGASLLRIQTPSSNGATMHLVSTHGPGRDWAIGSNFITGAGEFGIYDYSTGGGARLFITSTGNVGIGTTSPGQLLEVNGAAKVDGTLTATATSISGNVAAGTATITGSLSAGSESISGNTAIGGNAAITGTLTSNGNATVGTTGTPATMTVNGSVTVTGTLSSHGDTDTGNLTINSGNLTINTNGNKLIFPDGTQQTTAYTGTKIIPVGSCASNISSGGGGCSCAQGTSVSCTLDSSGNGTGSCTVTGGASCTTAAGISPSCTATSTAGTTSSSPTSAMCCSCK